MAWGHVFALAHYLTNLPASSLIPVLSSPPIFSPHPLQQREHLISSSFEAKLHQIEGNTQPWHSKSLTTRLRGNNWGTWHTGPAASVLFPLSTTSLALLTIPNSPLPVCVHVWVIFVSYHLVHSKKSISNTLGFK